MGGRSWARRVGVAIAILTLSLAAPARATWPLVGPAQPLVQAPRVCASGIVPVSTILSSGHMMSVNRRCQVLDFADIGKSGRHEWYYAFYHTHWADRHGKMDRGLMVFFYLQKPATLRLGLWIDDAPGLSGQWAKIPPPRPIVIKRLDGDYLGLTFKAVRGPDEQRLYRRDGIKWKAVSVLYRSDEDTALLAKVIPRNCEQVDDGVYDWTRFHFSVALKTKGGGEPCGALGAGLEIRDDRLYLTDAALEPAAEPVAPTRRP